MRILKFFLWINGLLIFEASSMIYKDLNKKPIAQKVWIRDSVLKGVTVIPDVLQSIRPIYVHEGQLIIQGNNTNGVHAYTSDLGKKKWSFQIKGGLAGDILNHKGHLFFVGADGFFYILSAQTGAVTWKFYIGQPSASRPVLQKNRLFIAVSNKLYCLNIQTKKLIWTYSVSLKKSEFVVEGVAEPLVSGNTIYFKTGDGTLFAINRNGRLKWKKYLSKKDRFTSALSAPIIGKVCLYSASFESGLYCLNKRNGKVIWKTPFGSHADLLLAGEYLFYSTSDGQVLALDQKSGKQIWSHKLLYSIATRLVLYKDYLIYGEYSGPLRLLSKKTGKEKGAFFFGKGMATSPLLLSEHSVLYFTSNFGWLYKLKLIL